jgi:hypothetical protein
VLTVDVEMIDIATPGGFDTPSNLQTITATVAP